MPTIYRSGVTSQLYFSFLPLADTAGCLPSGNFPLLVKCIPIFSKYQTASSFMVVVGEEVEC